MKVIDKTLSNNRRAVRLVEDCADILGLDQFEGLEVIYLLDFEEPRDARVYGRYFEKSDPSSAYINLFLDEVFRGVPKILKRTPVGTIMMTGALANLLGYHQSAKGRAERTMTDAEEKVFADTLREEALGKLRNKRHFRPWFWLIREIASWHVAFGKADYEFGDHELAIERLETALGLDPDSSHANEWYRYVLTKIEEKFPANDTDATDASESET